MSIPSPNSTLSFGLILWILDDDDVRRFCQKKGEKYAHASYYIVFLQQSDRFEGFLKAHFCSYAG